MNKNTTIALIGIICFITSFLLGGFIFGFINCDDCGWGISGIFGRIFIGIIMMILTVFNLGFPPQDEGATGEPHNVWPYIIFVFIAIFSIVMTVWSEKRKIKDSNKKG